MTGSSAAVLGAVLVVLVALVGVVQVRRSLRHRLDAVALRLGVSPVELGRGGPEAALSRLERAADAATAAVDEADAAVARMVRALEAIPQGIVLWDEGGREVFRNAFARSFTSARHADALVEQEVETELQAALDGTPQRRHLDLFGPPRRMLVVTAVPLDDGARTIGALAVIDDVSERRRLEAVRRDFVANISHELKTPIGALGLLAEAIAMEDDVGVTRRLAERMTDEAFRVARTIDDLLDLSRIEAEEAPRREPVPADLVVADAIERVRPLAESRAMSIDDAAVHPGHTVRGDRRQLASAVGNLLENACKYSDKGTTVEVSTRSDGGWVEIDVRDHGIGIPTRDLERVFERFYRVDRARSRDTGGTGLGLAIVRHVASNHRGEVRVSSREGEGSVFTLRLPASTGPGVVHTAEPAG